MVARSFWRRCAFGCIAAHRLRAIVRAGTQKAGTEAVVLGMWVRDREVLTTALGDSMTTAPATMGMHYRIGEIAETFMPCSC